ACAGLWRGQQPAALPPAHRKLHPDLRRLAGSLRARPARPRRVRSLSSGTSSPDEADARVWHPTGVRADLPDGTRRRVLIGSRPLVVVRVALRWYALDDTCPHRGGELS